MKDKIKLISILVLVILMISAFYVVFSYAGDEENKVKKITDNEKPIINEITGDTTGTLGKITTIHADFSDNINVTNATIFYKKENSNEWSSSSIIDGKYNLEIPKTSLKDWQYYIVVNDEAKNGPVGSPSIDGSKYYNISVRKNAKNLVHNVFIEEATASWCSNCPEIADILSEIYKSENYNFYYVSLVEDKNNKAKERLEEYNIYGYPTVYIDGGYDVVVGSNKDKSLFEEKIETASKRDVAQIKLNLTSEYLKEENEIKISANILNFEETDYKGDFKVYLTQRISSWQDYEGESYHFGFLKYIINQNIEIPSEEEIMITKSFDASSYDIENLMLLGVIFNSEKIEKYSNPSDKTNSFDAQYADCSEASFVVEKANLPPEVGITSVKNGRFHLFGKTLFATKNLNTFLIGRSKITVQADDDTSVEYVKLFVDDEQIGNLSAEPYEFNLKGPRFFKHDLKAVAVDDKGKKTTVTLNDVWMFILF